MNANNRSRQTFPTTTRVGRDFATLRRRYRDAAVSWIALGALLAAWHVEARLEQPAATDIDPRLAARTATPSNAAPIRVVRSEARSWMEGAPKGLRTR
ncbi:MAG TPA: hypothetical protein VEZ88_01070 [Steroidobacteraceae bacterium]|nr:hypothetical protein [Steroidobacteraceae bacterium]